MTDTDTPERKTRKRKQSVSGRTNRGDRELPSGYISVPQAQKELLDQIPQLDSTDPTLTNPNTLNYKVRRFVELYLDGNNATESALLAGYTPQKAKRQGEKLLGMPVIQTLLADSIARREAEKTVTPQQLIERLTQEIHADIADIYDGKNKIKPIHQWPKIWRQGLISEIRIVQNSNKNQIVTVKQSDRLQRLLLLGKYFKVFTDRSELEVFANESQSALSHARKTFTDKELWQLNELVYKHGHSENEAVKMVEAERESEAQQAIDADSDSS